MRHARIGGGRTRAVHLAFIVAFAVLTVSCTDTGPGHNLQGMNDTSEDVVVTFGTSSGGSYLLRSRTWGPISSGPSTPTGEIVVSDLACKELARLPWTSAVSTIRIESDGSIRIAEGHQTFPPDVRPLDHIEGGPLSSIRPC